MEEQKRYLHPEYLQERLHILAHRLYVSKGIPLGSKTLDDWNRHGMHSDSLKRRKIQPISRHGHSAPPMADEPLAVQDACRVNTTKSSSSKKAIETTAPKGTRKRSNKPWIERYKAHKKAIQAVGRWNRMENTDGSRPRVFGKRSRIPEEKAMSHRLSNLLHRKRFFDASCQEFHDFYWAELGYDFQQDWERTNKGRT
ncbi:hypothetical protein M9435_006147 [Picochlorum sp. BPE23]|nr:hypothetical protein M9435_006147 [Picochlorum sp. BPE23]